MWKEGLVFRVLIFAFSALMNEGIVDYDSSLDLPSSHVPVAPPCNLLRSIVKWDSLYFLEVAHNGYMYEKNHAFFPFYPMLIRFFGEIIGLSGLDIECSYILAGVLISWISFAAASEMMYSLSRVLFSETRAELSTYLFIVNPAGVFMSALYTTSLFSFLSISGLYFFYKDLSLENKGKSVITVPLKNWIAGTL